MTTTERSEGGTVEVAGVFSAHSMRGLGHLPKGVREELQKGQEPSRPPTTYKVGAPTKEIMGGAMEREKVDLGHPQFDRKE
ncbi:hypothetical protein CDL15_Pgr016848 [Punica granatum]|uniref:Uncharacterized protein n=1 Tax=Punica granatum TaxID=22663 RepID=A0A218WYZ4_PUNGR|nr:hypothetical protein CDL15_Pgr016848 [Punica granatum]